MNDTRYGTTHVIASTIASLLLLVTVVPASSAALSATDPGPDPAEGPCLWVYPEELWVVVDPDCLDDILPQDVRLGALGSMGGTTETVGA